MICTSFSKLASPSVPKCPSWGSRRWQPSQVKPSCWPKMVPAMPSDRRGPRKKLRPFCCAGVSELSSARFGFGGSMISRAKSVNFCMSAGVELAVAAHQPREGLVEVVERVDLVEGRAPRAGRVGTVAAPVHGAAAVHPAQRLRRHRALHGMEVGQHARAVDRRRQREDAGVDGDAELDRDGVALHRVVRVAQIPRQVVHVAEDVAARARRLAVARRLDGVVQERPPARRRAPAPGCAAPCAASRRGCPGRPPTRCRRSASARRAARAPNRGRRRSGRRPSAGCSSRWPPSGRTCRSRARRCSRTPMRAEPKAAT